MAPADVAAALALIGGLAAVLGAFVRSDRRLQLHLTHPALAWILLTAVFFGAGSLALAFEGRAAAAAYAGGALFAFAGGHLLSDILARRRLAADGPPTFTPSGPLHLRAWAVIAMAGLGLLAVAPALLRSGLPFLAPNVTGARTELSGLTVQLLRVALPAAAGVALLLALRSTGRRRRWLWLAIAIVTAFVVLLATRYLLAELVAVLVLAALLAGRRLPIRTGVAIAAVGLVVFTGIQLVRAYDQARGRELEFVVERTVSRVVLVQPRTIEALMLVIPAEQEHFLGATWVRRLAPLLGREEPPNLGYWIYPRVVSRDEQDVAGYAAPGWLGEAWANFGWTGLVLFVVLGAAVERLAALIAARRLRFGGRLPVVDAVAAAMAILFVARTHALGVNGLAVVLVLVAAWRLVAGPPAGLIADVRATLRWRT